MGRTRAESPLGGAVHKDAERSRELDLEPGMNPSGMPLECGNLETMEDLLVAAKAHWFSGRLKKQFHEVVYAPNRFVERACGFDLSIAPLNTREYRLRVQNKVVTTWCDLPSTITLKATRWADEKKRMTSWERLQDQVARLCTLYHASGTRAVPYLLIQQCYCLHDYRRMGREDLDVKSPPIHSKYRSMAIELADETFIAAINKHESWTFQLTPNPPADTVACLAIMPDGFSVPLIVRDLEGLAKLLE
jgi:hypothetical protein